MKTVQERLEEIDGEELPLDVLVKAASVVLRKIQKRCSSGSRFPDGSPSGQYGSLLMDGKPYSCKAPCKFNRVGEHFKPYHSCSYGFHEIRNAISTISDMLENMDLGEHLPHPCTSTACANRPGCFGWDAKEAQNAKTD